MYKWSCNNYSDFWKEIWNFGGLIYSKSYDQVVDVTIPITENPEWFHGATLNYAENILKYNDDKIALIGAGKLHVLILLIFL